jgi:hypothetical protein
MPTPTWNALTDPLPRWDPKSQELAYNNYTDRMKVELPQFGDVAASGVVSVVSASGTASIPVYLTSGIPVAVEVDITTDSIKVFSASGTPTIPVYLTQPVSVEVDIGDEIRIASSSGTPNIPVYMADGEGVYGEDQPHINKDKGFSVLAVRNDSIGSLVGADKDYANLQLNAYGSLRTQLDMVRDVSVTIGNGFADSGTIRVAVASGLIVDSPNPESGKLISKRFTYNTQGDIDTIKEALATTPSGSPCKVQTFSYNPSLDVDYIIESLGTW